MRRGFVSLAMVGITMLAACGGGGTTTPSIPPPSTQPGPSSQPTSSPTTQPTVAPTAAPTVQPTVAPQGNTPLIENVGGSPAYVDPANHHTLYFEDGDVPPGSLCSPGCTDEWPVMVASAGSQPQSTLTIVTRASDGIMQWVANGHGLYHFIGDSGADQMNGVYGPWHIARP